MSWVCLAAKLTSDGVVEDEAGHSTDKHAGAQQDDADTVDGRVACTVKTC